MPLTFGSLFAGIGGFDLGLERAGMKCSWQVEIDDYANKVLEKHWPDVKRCKDVRECGSHNLESVDLICGGFPCQPHSLAGKRQASNDERDLWEEFSRIIRELRPRYVVAENVPGILSSESGRFFGRVLRDLAACGYDAEWQCLPASAFGAPHRRDRVWIVAYPFGNEYRNAQRSGVESEKNISNFDRSKDSSTGEFGGTSSIRSTGQKHVADSRCQHGKKRAQEQSPFRGMQTDGETCNHVERSGDVANAQGKRCREAGQLRCQQSKEWSASCGEKMADTDSERCKFEGAIGRRPQKPLLRSFSGQWDWWKVEPDICRVVDGLPNRSHRLKCLGNAVVPQIVEFLGRLIVKVAPS